MKAVFIDNQVYLIMGKSDAQAVAAACYITQQQWHNGDEYAKERADILRKAERELVHAILEK